MKGLLLGALLMSVCWYGVEGEFISIPPPPRDLSSKVDVIDTDLRADPWRKFDNTTELLKEISSGKPLSKLSGQVFEDLQKKYKYCEFLAPKGPPYTPAICVKESDCQVVAPFTLTEWGNKTCRRVAQGMVDTKIVTQEEANTFTCCPLTCTKDYKLDLQHGNVSESEGSTYVEYNEIPATLIQENVSYIYINSYSYDTHNEEVSNISKEQLEQFFVNNTYEEFKDAIVCGFAKHDLRIYPFFCVEPSECGKHSSGAVISKVNPLWHQFCQPRFTPQLTTYADPKYSFPPDPNNKKTVCCHVNDMEVKGHPYIVLRQIPSFFKYGTGLRSVFKCEEYAKRVCQKDHNGDDMCVDGFSSPPDAGENPHMASLGVVIPRLMYFICGGTLISVRYILSAETCETYWGYKVNVAWLGSYATQEYDYRRERIFLITDILKTQGSPPAFQSLNGKADHDKYSYDEIDIALYKLDREVEYTRYIRPACLWYGHNEWPNNPQFLGFSSPDFYRRSYLHTITDLRVTSRCGSEAFNQDEIQFPYHGKFGAPHPWHVCLLDHPDTGVGGKYTFNPCDVDQGGPLQNKLTSPFCATLLLGVLSSRAYCRPDQLTPSAFVNVSHFVRAIEDAIWGNHIFEDLDTKDMQKPSCGNPKNFFFFDKCENGNDCPEE